MINKEIGKSPYYNKEIEHYGNEPSEKCPLVSIYIPTKNRLELLRRAVDSALKQNYENIEIIVIDDGSVDGTLEYLKRMSFEDARLRFISNGTSLGACHSRNSAIFLAKGFFITGLDDDDYFLENHISSMVEFWNRRSSSTVALFPNLLLIDENKELISCARAKIVKRKSLIDSNEIGNQVFTTTSELIKINGFSIDFPAWQDLECWYRLLDNEKCAECTNKSTYVIDTSHQHERISTRKLELINVAYEKFLEKHDVSGADKDILAIQLKDYTAEQTFIIKTIRKLFGKHTLRKAIIRAMFSIKNWSLR